MKLHEAIYKLLVEMNSSMSTSDIAEALNENGWYEKKDGSLIKPSQIGARVNNYPDWFTKNNGLIRPKNGHAVEAIDQTIERATSNQYDLTVHESISEASFSLFDPESMSPSSIPNKPGVYIFCLKQNSELPDASTAYKASSLFDLDVIYADKAANSLRKRLINQHIFGRNAGRSTLRKSLGSLLRYEKVPRDKDPNTGKTKFCDHDESNLTRWMENNLLVYYRVVSNPDRFEDELIDTYNPPLNLSKNYNPINTVFRKKLSALRN